MSAPVKRVLLAALAVAALVFVMVRPTLRGRTDTQKLEGWSAVIREKIKKEPVWRNVRSIVDTNSVPGLEMRGIVDSEPALVQLKSEVEDAKIPYPIKWSVKVATNSGPQK